MGLFGERRVELTCQQCGKPFTVPKSKADKGAKYCGSGCFEKARGTRVRRQCPTCGKKIYVTPSAIESGQGRYCSKSCADKAHYKRIALTCLMCGKPFELEESRAMDGRGRFCSKRCQLRHKGETSIEQLMREELETFSEPFEQQVKFKRYHVDFVLPRRMAIIECDGTYGHGLFGVKLRDQRKDDYLTSLGYQVFRFNDREIRESPSDCVNRVLLKARSDV